MSTAQPTTEGRHDRSRKSPPEPYELVIEPSRSLLRVDWKGLIHYRDLLWILVRRDFVAQYKQTVLGPVWFVLQPLMTTVVFTVIFGRVARISTDGLPPLLFYMCGMLAWNFFSGCLAGTSTTLISNAGLFGKVYFPRLIVPFAAAISKLVGFAVQLVLFLAVWAYFKFFTVEGAQLHVSWMLAFIPLLLLQSALLALGVGLFMSALTAKYRDFLFLSNFLSGLWMYLTPVIYPMSSLPEAWRVVFSLNPMTGIVEAYRFAFLGSGTVDALSLLLSAVVTGAILLLGLMAFGRAERTFIDTV